MEPVQSIPAPVHTPHSHLVPVQRSHVFSDESSLQGCGSVSSCFNWIYSFLASIWNALFGAAEKPTKDLVWEELTKNPEALADKLAKSPDHGQAKYIELFDKYAKLDHFLIPSAAFEAFSVRYWDKTEEFHDDMRDNKEFFTRLLFGAPDKTDELPKAPASLLVSIAKDNAVDLITEYPALIIEYPAQRDEIIRLLKPTAEQRSKVQKETQEVLSDLLNNVTDENIENAVYALYRYEAMGKNNALPVITHSIPVSVLRDLVQRILLIHQVGGSSKDEHNEMMQRVQFFTLLPSFLKSALESSAKDLLTQPMPYIRHEIESFIEEETGKAGKLYYDSLNNDIHFAFAKVYNTANPNEHELSSMNVKETIKEAKIDGSVLLKYYFDTPFEVFRCTYGKDDSLGVTTHEVPNDEDTSVYLVEISNRDMPNTPPRYAYYVIDHGEEKSSSSATSQEKSNETDSD